MLKSVAKNTVNQFKFDRQLNFKELLQRKYIKGYYLLLTFNMIRHRIAQTFVQISQRQYFWKSWYS